MSQFAGVAMTLLPELWRFKQYDIGENLSAVRLMFKDRDPNDEKKFVDDVREYLMVEIDLPGKTLFLNFEEGPNGTVLMNVLEEENFPPRPNKFLLLEFGDPLPVGQFSYVGSVELARGRFYVFAVSGIKMAVDERSRRDVKDNENPHPKDNPSK